MKMVILEKIVFLMGLSFLSYQDYRKKEVSLALILLLGIFGMIFRLTDGKLQWASLLAGMSIGVIFMLLSFLTGGKIGVGDGLVLIVSGVYLGFWRNLSMCLIALSLAGLNGLLLLLMKRCKKEDTLPFFPFLLAGYVILLLQK